MIPDPYRYDNPSPEVIIPNFFKGVYDNPKKQTINGIDVYLSRYNGDSPEYRQMVKGLIVLDDQYIEFDGHGAPSETDTIYQILEKMLSSLRVEK